MAIGVVYLAALVSFLVIDAIALKWVMYPLFTEHIGDLLRENVQVGVALAFYFIYVSGVVYFAVLPAHEKASFSLALLNGAILGFLTYGTYEATNMATIKGWSMSLVVVDTLWGAVLTATVASVGYTTARWIL